MPAPPGPATRLTLVASHRAGGVPVHVRPLAAADGPRFAAAFDALGHEGRTQRFLGPKPSLSPAEVRFFTDVDHRSHEALGAFDAAGALVGAARYVAYPDRPGVADFAFFVVAAWQGRGIGRLLGRAVVARAIAEGFAGLTATTLADNVASLRALAAVGFRDAGRGRGVRDLVLDLPAEALRAA